MKHKKLRVYLVPVIKNDDLDDEASKFQDYEVISNDEALKILKILEPEIEILDQDFWPGFVYHETGRGYQIKMAAKEALNIFVESNTFKTRWLE